METLQTERLTLRLFRADDLEGLVALDADPEVMFFITGGTPTPRDEVEREELPDFRRVIEKAGLRSVRAFHADWPVRIPGGEHGDVEYAITRGEWLADRGLSPG